MSIATDSIDKLLKSIIQLDGRWAKDGETGDDKPTPGETALGFLTRVTDDEFGGGLVMTQLARMTSQQDTTAGQWMMNRAAMDLILGTRLDCKDATVNRSQVLGSAKMSPMGGKISNFANSLSILATNIETK